MCFTGCCSKDAMIWMKYAELDQSIDWSEMFFAMRSRSTLDEESEEIGVNVG